jgi:hypothetical protein
MRHTVSSLGAFAEEEEEDDGVPPAAAFELELELEPELQPAMASAAAAQAAAAVILCRTAGVLPYLLAQTSRLARLRFGMYRRN